MPDEPIHLVPQIDSTDFLLERKLRRVVEVADDIRSALTVEGFAEDPIDRMNLLIAELAWERSRIAERLDEIRETVASAEEPVRFKMENHRVVGFER